MIFGEGSRGTWSPLVPSPCRPPRPSPSPWTYAMQRVRPFPTGRRPLNEHGKTATVPSRPRTPHCPEVARAYGPATYFELDLNLGPGASQKRSALFFFNRLRGKRAQRRALSVTCGSIGLGKVHCVV